MAVNSRVVRVCIEFVDAFLTLGKMRKGDRAAVKGSLMVRRDSYVARKKGTEKDVHMIDGVEYCFLNIVDVKTNIVVEVGPRAVVEMIGNPVGADFRAEVLLQNYPTGNGKPVHTRIMMEGKPIIEALAAVLPADIDRPVAVRDTPSDFCRLSTAPRFS